MVIPLYNLRSFVGEAIASALAQQVVPEQLEVVVVDDGSTDGGGDIAVGAGDRVRYLRQSNRGLSAARNVGIAATTAPFVQLLDADDRIDPEKLAMQLRVFDAVPADVGVVYSGWRYIDDEGCLLTQRGWPKNEGAVLSLLLQGNLHPPVAPLVRREAIMRVGGFDETLTSVEDWNLWLRIARAGFHWRHVDRPLADYRVRGDGMHRNAPRMMDNRLRVIDGFFADPTIPTATHALRDRAIANACLVSACELYVSGHRMAGAQAMRRAASLCPELVASSRGLRRICRELLPLGARHMRGVVAMRRALLRQLDDMLDDLRTGRPSSLPLTSRLHVRAARLALGAHLTGKALRERASA